MQVSLQLLCVRSNGHKVNAKQKGQAGCPGCPLGFTDSRITWR